MKKLPANILELVHQYKSIESNGFKLYPFKVKEYEQFLIARQSIGFMTQQLPVELMSLPLLSALFKVDFDLTLKGHEPTGLFASCLVAIAFALRLTHEGETAGESCERFDVVTYPDDPSRLKCLRFLVDGEELQTITPVQFAKLRPIIAAQNGIEIIDEDANPELVRAEQDLLEGKAPKLDFDKYAMIHSIAAMAHVDEADIFEWPVLKLHDRMESYKRVIDYIICGIGESQGTQWKGGNPCPNPWFNRIKEGSASLIGLDSFAGGQASASVLSGEATRQSNADDDTANDNILNSFVPKE